jgi:DNA-directed RNA polymerase II subunit RPB2
MVDHQVDSYEDFVRHKIPLIMQSTPPITVWHEQDELLKKYKYEFKLSFENVSYIKPRIQEATGRVKPMLPMEARIRNFTYAAQMHVDIRFVVRTYKGPMLDTYDEESHVFEGISLGKLPVMLGSSLCLLKDYPMSLAEYGECAHDPLGYFIIHGSERTILCQEKVADNRIMIFQNKKSASKHTHSVEIKSLHESFTMPPKKLEIRLSSKFNGYGNPLTACVPRFREDIPVVVYFRALGVLTDREITRIVWGSEDDLHVELLAASFRDAAELRVFTQQEAVQYLTNHLQYGTNQEDKCAYVRQLLNSELLPHVRFAGELTTTPVHNARKTMLMGAMIRRLLLTYCKQIPLDDRDAYPNKRVVTTGALLTHLFRQLFQKVCNDTRNEFVQEVNNDSWKRGEGGPRPMDVLNGNNLYKILKLSAIEGKLKQALATGNFAVQGLGSAAAMSNATKVGVSQVLARMSYAATLSHLRRIQTPVEKSGKLLAPRKLHGTSWGFMCPVETPEGHSVGIVKNMSLLTSISQHTPSTTILHYLQEVGGIEWIDTPRVYEGTSVTVNGVIVGYTKDPHGMVVGLRLAKQTRRLHPHISVAWYTLMNSVSVETDGGRCVRPVFRAGMTPPTDTTSWNEWCKSSIDYIDSSETETLRIAISQDEMTPAHTHYEVHPSLIVGHMASTIPLSDHNQSPRNTYQSAMGKQAMCVYAGNFAKRLDKNAYVLCSIARPIVETRAMNILKMHEMPFGFNGIVAIACYGGYNQEDSVIMNKSSVKRGFFRGLYYGMYKDEEHRNVTSGREEKFMRPQKHNTRKYKNTSYAAVSDNGLPILNSVINENDVIIGKVVNLRNDAAGYAFRDASTTHKNSEQCRIDGVWQDKNSDGYPFIKVRTVSERIPQIGDKVSSRHGQKGTIGMMMEEEDMPFTASGLRPDIIMNPHAVPSRMTIAQLMENIFGKIGVRKGTLGDGTPYSHLKVEDLKRHMIDMGLHPYGNEILYNGQTGEMMQAEIFMGPTFYQRLKHMVIDKKHCMTDDHDVLTTAGWKPINAVTLEDRVATLQNGQVVYEYPLQTFEYDYEGDMYEVEADQLSLKVTPNHQMWVAKSYTRRQEWRYGFHEAADIMGKHVKYQKDGDWSVPAYQIVLPGLGSVDMDAWLTFFGIWIGDGWCTDSRVTIAANKPRVKSALDACLPRLNLAYRYYPDSCKVDISDKNLRAYMRPLSVGATNKQLPDWVWELNKEQSLTLISGLLLSDGHTGGSGSLLYSTSSTKLADDIQRLALHAGWSANKRLHTAAGSPYTIGNHSGVTTQDLWLLAFIRAKNRPAMNHGHHKMQNGQSEHMVPFNGKVYCLEVPGHVFYVRRNGKPVWTGNSRARGPIVSLTRQPCEGRSRDGGLRVGEMERDCMLSHGISVFTKERLMDVSDPFKTGLCKSCGTLAVVNPVEGIYSCGACGNKTDFVMKTIPYAMKLWMQELEAMHITPKLILE